MKFTRPRGVQQGMMILPLAVSLLLAAAPVASVEPTAPVAPVPEAAGVPEGESVVNCAEEIARRVQRRYESVERLEARFEQRMRSVAFGSSSMGSAPTRGHVAFSKPGRMRWAYEEPEPSLVVSDGSTLWIYDPAAGEAQSMPVDEGYLSGAAFQFLLGEGDILASFDVGAVDCEAPVVRLVLRPSEPSTYQLLEIRTDPATGDVHGTAVEDLFGNRTEVDFLELKTNPDLAAGLFSFVPPEGVRVEALQPLGQPPGAAQ